MNLKKYYTLNWIIRAGLAFSLLVSSFLVIGQTVPPRPATCTVGNGDGYEDMAQSISSSIAYCSTFSNPNKQVTIPFSKGGRTFTNVKYYFSIQADFDILSPNVAAETGVENGNNWQVTKELTPGFHWFMITVEEGGKKLKKCSYTEVIPITSPVVEFSTCDPTQIELVIPDVPENKHQKYIFDYGAGTPEEILVSNEPLPIKRTRPNTGNQVYVTGEYLRNGAKICPTLPSKVDPVSANTPYMDYLELTNEGEGALIKFKKFKTGENYELERTIDNGTGGYNWQSVGDVKDGSVNISGLDKTKIYCFRLAAKDKCGNSVYSPIICSSNLNATQGSSQSVELDWNKPSSPNLVPNRLELEKVTVGCTSGSCINLPYVNVLDEKWGEEDLDCQLIYTYQLVYKYKNSDGQDIIIKSDLVEIDPKGGSVQITPKDLVAVGYMPNDEETIRIIVQRNDFKKFDFFRAPAYSDDFISIGSSATNDIDDISVKPDAGAYCYKYEFEDVCGTISNRSPEFCTVFLSGNASKINWTPYTFPESVVSNTSDVEYTVEIFDTKVNTWVPRFTTKDTSQGIFDVILNSKESQVKFRIQAKQYVTGTTFPGQFIYSYSNTIIINVPPNVFLPSAFTPNDDGINDTFSAYQKFIKEGSIVVYDRWGAILFETDNLQEAWDGTDMSGTSPAPAGNYAFRIQGISDAGESFKKSGSITIIR